jgi:hypothetical protein
VLRRERLSSRFVRAKTNIFRYWSCIRACEPSLEALRHRPVSGLVRSEEAPSGPYKVLVSLASRSLSLWELSTPDHG